MRQTSFKKPVVYTLFVLCLIFITNPIIAQPGGGGGLQIMKIYDADGELISNSDTMLQIRHYVLSGKKYKVKKEINPQEINSNYRYSDKVYTRIFLPPFITNNRKRIELPDQRMQLFYGGDTMTIDFIGIVGENPSGRTDHIETIEFKPGYFKCYRNPQQSRPQFWNDTALTQKQKDEIYRLLYQGLDISSVFQLKNLGLIEFTPPAASKTIKATTKKKIKCIDTSSGYGYTTLCPHNISIKENAIEITTMAQPVVTDSARKCYKFFYYLRLQGNLSRINDDEFKDTYTFFREIRTARLTINQQLFSGCIKISSITYNVGLNRDTVYSILVLYYENGKVIKEESLYDVDPRTEKPIIARLS